MDIATQKPMTSLVLVTVHADPRKKYIPLRFIKRVSQILVLEIILDKVENCS
ncbi:MAG: hypothetical protein WCO26_13455 [Deltaproteobacteria bacterium]